MRKDNTVKTNSSAANTTEPIVTQDQINTLEDELKKKDSLLDKLRNSSQKLKDDLKIANDSSRILTESEKRYIKLLKKK